MSEDTPKYYVVSEDQIRLELVHERTEQHGASFYVLSDTPISPDTCIDLFSCDVCGVQFGCEDDHDPFCIACGSLDVGDGGNSHYPCEPLMQHNFSVPCSKCDSANSMSFYGAHALNGRVHCVSCGARLDYVFPQDVAEYMEAYFQRASARVP